MSSESELLQKLRELAQNWRERQPSMHPDADNQYESAKLDQLRSCADELEELLS